MVKIAYDAGHGLNTPGKRTPDGEREWTFNNTVVLAFEEELKRYKNVQLLRTDDVTGKTDVPLEIRTSKANNWKADYYLSFHHNASSGVWGNATGVETFIYLGSQPQSERLAKAIHPAVVSSTGLRDRGIKQGNLYIVRKTNMPAVLIEGGFMDSRTDIKVLRNTVTLKKMGTMIAQALAKYLKLELKETAPSKPSLPSQPNKPQGGTNMKMSDILTASQMKQLEESYKNAFDKKVLTSDQWYKKAQNKTITLAEVSYVNAVLIDRYNK